MKNTIREKISKRIIFIGAVMVVLSFAFFYILFVPKMEEDAVERAENTNMEIVQQIDTLISFVQDYTENLALSVAQNQEILRCFSQPEEQDKNVAALHLNNLISYEGKIRCVMIDDGIVPVLDSLNEVTDEDRQLLESEWYKKVSEADYGRSVSQVYTVEINNAQRLTAAYAKNFYHANKKYTYLVFIDLNDLVRDFRMLAKNTLDYAELVDGTGNIFSFQGDEEWRENTIEDLNYAALSTTENRNGGIRFLSTSVASKWKVVSYVADQTIFMTFSYYVIGMLSMLVLFLLLALVVISKAVGKIVEPISILSASMKEVAKGNLDYQVNVSSDDEIGLLGQSFNKMTKELKNSMEVIAEKEKEEQQIKFSLLISQIDPHFIYNTINSINYLARRERCCDIIQVNSALIFILQDRLRINNIQFTDTIENEKRVIEQYIVIERYMYEGELKLTWDIEPALYKEQIPKNMIQPLVENALFHGLIDEESGEVNGEITVTIKRTGGDIVVKVSDNGLGMDEKQLRTVKEGIYGPEERGKRIGLSNIRQRLYYLYGSTDVMQIESTKHVGTCITLRFRRKYFE